MNNVAAKAVAFKEALQPEFRVYSEQVIKNAKILAEELMKRGHRIISDGTDNHLMLVDVTKKGKTGKEAEKALETAGISCNKNMIPFDERSPMDPSGIRLGTPAVTTRGMKEKEIQQIATWIDTAIDHANDETTLKRIKGEVKELCGSFPVPGIRV